MAKKAVASLKTSSKKLVKAIRVVKKDEDKGYCFVEKMLPQDLVNDWLAGKPIEIKQHQLAKEEPKAEEPAKEEPKVEESSSDDSQEEVTDTASDLIFNNLSNLIVIAPLAKC